MDGYRFSVVIEETRGGFHAFCPELEGLSAEGSSYEEVLDNIKKAIEEEIEFRLLTGAEIPQEAVPYSLPLDIQFSLN